MRIDRYNLDIIFRKIPPECVHAAIRSNNRWNGCVPHKNVITVSSVPKSVFVRLACDCSEAYTKDERHEQYMILQTKMHNGIIPGCSVFNLLYAFAEDVLTTSRYIPECKFSEILRWQDTTHKLGQDLFTTVYLACCDTAAATQNTFFAWMPILGHNNIRLKHLLSQGVAENHYHLNGSSQSFPINWVLIMNHPEAVFYADTWGDDLEHHLSFGDYYNAVPWSVKLFWAATIRAYLFQVTHGIENHETESGLSPEQMLNRQMACTDRLEATCMVIDLKRQISLLRILYGHVALFDHAPLDYALEKTMNPSNFQLNRILAGERKWMYDCFRKVSDNTLSERDQNLFYLYLLIKSNFRSEFIQTNNEVGFLNFEEYQNRKDYFYDRPEYADYKDEAYRLSLNAVLKFQPIRSLEARIMPNKSHRTIEKNIRHIDTVYTRFEQYCNQETPYTVMERNNSLLPNRPTQDYFFVLHYPKRKDVPVQDSFLYYPRNYVVRERNKRFTISLYSALRRSVYLRDAILGIDACSNEIGCRPEVFAVDFRRMRTIIPKNKSGILSDIEHPVQLNITYHVGEDFLNITDGLRAIDECIRFLGMGQGDRFGHAVALGIDAKAYYESKGYRLIMPKQDLLDDDIWILFFSSALGIHIPPDLRTILNERSEKLMEYIYGSFAQIHKVSLTRLNYYNAWKLRGDAPELYKTGELKNSSNDSLFGYATELKNKYLTEDYLRKEKNAVLLYYAYHYDTDAKKRGSEIEVVKVSKEYAQLVAMIQKEMQFYVSKLDIMIECNPTSNYLIGSMDQYDMHPLTVFNNLDLEISEENRRNCAQLSVSINTDDQGVFDTLLCNEYALMSAALEKKRDVDGMRMYSPSQVYNYIDSVRKMGFEQSFLMRKKLIITD